MRQGVSNPHRSPESKQQTHAMNRLGIFVARTVSAPRFLFHGRWLMEPCAARHVRRKVLTTRGSRMSGPATDRRRTPPPAAASGAVVLAVGRLVAARSAAATTSERRAGTGPTPQSDPLGSCHVSSHERPSS